MLYETATPANTAASSVSQHILFSLGFLLLINIVTALTLTSISFRLTYPDTNLTPIS